MIKKEITKKKSFQMNIALVAIGVLLVLGCPASNNSTGPGPGDRGSDTTAPTITSSVPVADAMDFNASSNIVLTFSEDVQAGTGNITLTPTTSGSSAPTLTIDVTDTTQVSFFSARVTINPTADLAVSTTYALSIAAGAIEDLADNSAAIVNLSFSTAAEKIPVVISSVPVAGATDFRTDDNIVLTFSEEITARTALGNTTITPMGGAPIMFNISDNTQVSVSGAVLTIDLTANLELNTQYVLTIPAGFIEYDSRESNAEITLSFTTVAVLVPKVISSVPTAGAMDFNASSNIVLTYSEAVQAGSGNITLTPMSGTPLTIAVTAGQVTIVGAVVTINPTANLELGTMYTLTVPVGGFTDTSGNSTAEITLSFSTAANIVPTLSSSVPAEGATDAAVDSNIVLTFSEAVIKGSGGIRIIKNNLPVAETQFPVSSGNLSISGAVATLDPHFDFTENSAYTLSFPAGAFVSSADQTSVPAFSLSFSTPDTIAPTLSLSVPAEGATDFSEDDNIVLTYNEAVQAGSGNITLTPMGGGMPLTIAVTDAQVTIVGAVVTINPTADLMPGAQYTLSILSGVFTDASGNVAPGLTRSFTVALLPPMVISSVPTEGGTLNISGGNSIIMLTYNQPIVKGSGNIMLETSNDRMNMIAVSNDEQVTISGTVVSINISSFSSGRDSSDTNLYPVALTVPVSAFANADGNNPLGDFTLTFEEL